MATMNSRKSCSCCGRQWYLLVIIVVTVFNVAVQIWIQNRCMERVPNNTIGGIVDEHKRAFAHTQSTNPLAASSGAAHHQTHTPGDVVCWENYQRAIADRLMGITDEDVLRSKTFFGNRYRISVLANVLGMDTISNSNNNTIPHKAVSAAKRPVKAIVCGGSISLGHGVKVRYSDRLQDWLNDKFPVSDSFHTTRAKATTSIAAAAAAAVEAAQSDDSREDGSDSDSDSDKTKDAEEPYPRHHIVLNKGSHGADICAMAKRLNRLIHELGPDIDLFVLEFAVNDYQGQDHVKQIEDRMDTFFDGFEEIAVCTESVLIRLLKSYPEAAIVFLEMRTAVLPRKSGAVVHMGAAQHYQIPVISYEQALWPDYYRLVETLGGSDQQYSKPINDTVLPFPHGCHPCVLDDMEDDDVIRNAGCQSLCDHMSWTWADALYCEHQYLPPGREPCYVPFFAHDEVHPSGIGHRIASDLIVDTIARTGLDLCREQQHANHNSGSSSGTTSSQGEGRLRQHRHQQQHQQPQKQQYMLLEKRDIMPRVGWMTSDPLILDAQTNFLSVNDTYMMFTDKHGLVPSDHTEGFALLEDKFQRWGWIATNEKGGESITFEIDVHTESPSGDPGCYIPYLSVLMSYENMGKMVVKIHDRVRKKETVKEIDSLWEPKISIPHDVQLIAANDFFAERENGCSGDCSVTITSLPMVGGRSGNKIKLVTLSVRPCIPEEVLPEEVLPEGVLRF